MTSGRLLSDRFPRSSKHNPDWLIASASGGATALWLTEWLSESLDLRPGMRVLDLGCGRATSSIFLHREFGVEDNSVEIRALEADRGQYLGYVRVVARRRPGMRLDDPVVSLPAQYSRQPLLRGGG